MNWLRNLARQAVLAGVSDALAALEAGSEETAAAARLEARSRPALPAPAEEEKPRGRKERAT